MKVVSQCSKAMAQYLYADGQENSSCVVQTVKFGGGGITMWGAMSFRGTGFLTRVVGNLNGAWYINILSDSAVPSAHYLSYRMMVLHVTGQR